MSAVVPVGGIIIIAFLAVQMSVDPVTGHSGDILTGIVRIIPAACFGEPQGSQSAAQIGRGLRIRCCRLGEFGRCDHGEGWGEIVEKKSSTLGMNDA